MKQLTNTKVTVRACKAEDRKEWCVYIESYPVNVPRKQTPQRVREYLNRCITTVEWDKNVLPEPMQTEQNLQNPNGMIME